MAPDTVPDPDRCAREPIHIPGAIQPHGVLLLLGPGPKRIVQVASANAESLLGLSATPLDGTLAEALGDTTAAQVARALEAGVGAVPFRVDLRSGAWDATAVDTPGGTLLELEPADEDEAGSVTQLYGRVRSALARLQSSRTIEVLFRTMAEGVRELTGMARVMVYRFDPDWNGEVVAESRTQEMATYLGLRFPASDIPAQARELYRRNWLRLIAAVDYTPVPLVPPLHPETGEPVDLSASALRSVSAVHRAYLRNMDVAASMSISLLRHDTLWGLVACHHPEPLHVPASVRAACEFLGQTFSIQLGHLVDQSRRDEAFRLAAIETALLERVATNPHWMQALADGEPGLEDVAGAEGAALRVNGRVVLSGDAPPDEAAVDTLAD